MTQWHSDTAHAHAVTHLNGDRRAWYDANGNMTQRVEVAVVDRSGSQRITYTQEWDVENKLVARMQSEVTNTVTGQVTRFYADCIRRDADGALVKKSDGAGTVMIVNGLYEEAGGVATSYYTFGSQRVAMRTGGAVYWLHGDHLGSASMTTNASGQSVAELRYLPFGETRWAWGVTPTDRRYTGQRELPAIGLYDYAVCDRAVCDRTRACTGRLLGGSSARIRWCLGPATRSNSIDMPTREATRLHIPIPLATGSRAPLISPRLPLTLPILRPTV